MTIVNLRNEASDSGVPYLLRVWRPQWGCHALLNLASYVAQTVRRDVDIQSDISVSQSVRKMNMDGTHHLRMTQYPFRVDAKVIFTTTSEAFTSGLEK